MSSAMGDFGKSITVAMSGAPEAGFDRAPAGVGHDPYPMLRRPYRFRNFYAEARQP